MTKRITQKDVAQALGISHATVSFVLNNRTDVAIPEQTRAKVWDKARELGYRPNLAAQALVLGKSYAIGVRMPLGELGSEILHQIWVGAEKRGLGVMLTGGRPVLVDGEFIWDGKMLTLELFGISHEVNHKTSVAETVHSVWEKFDQVANLV